MGAAKEPAPDDDINKTLQALLAVVEAAKAAFPGGDDPDALKAERAFIRRCSEVGGAVNRIGFRLEEARKKKESDARWQEMMAKLVAWRKERARRMHSTTR